MVTIYRLKMPGWYDFKDVPQGYVKVHGMNCGSDDAALAYAKKLNSSLEYKIV